MKIGLKQIVMIFGVLGIIGGLISIAEYGTAGLLALAVGVAIFYYGWKVMK